MLQYDFDFQEVSQVKMCWCGSKTQSQHEMASAMSSALMFACERWTVDGHPALIAGDDPTNTNSGQSHRVVCDRGDLAVQGLEFIFTSLPRSE